MILADTPTLVSPRALNSTILKGIKPVIFDRQPKQGAEFLVLTISPQGQVISCKTRVAGPVPFHDQPNCSLVKCLRYSPALDKSGSPTFAKVVISVTWETMSFKEARIDKYQSISSSPIFNDPSVAVIGVSKLPAGFDNRNNASINLLIDEHGLVQDCTVAKSSGATALDKIACPVVRAESGFEPALNVAGETVKSIESRRVFFIKNVVKSE